MNTIEQKTITNFNTILHPATESKKTKSEVKEYTNVNTINSKTPKKNFTSVKKNLEFKEVQEIAAFDYNKDLHVYAPTEMSMKNTFKSKMMMSDFNGEEEQWKELIFKIKLNESEYKLLLKEKSKIVVKTSKFSK